MISNSIGYCLGATSIGMVVLEQGPEGVRIQEASSRSHEGDLPGCFTGLLEKARGQRTAITGRKFRGRVLLPSISEPEAVELAFGFVKDRYPGVQAIVSAGGESFMVYELDRSGRISTVHTGNKCASGTGDFFLQQLKRMGLGMGEAMGLGDGQKPYRIASRCSVFSKSDCTHALNKGEPKGSVVSGLCHMIASKILALLQKAKLQRVLFVGGVAQNPHVVTFLREELEDVQVPEEAPYFEALGTALWALDHAPAFQGSNDIFAQGKAPFGFLSPLAEHTGKVIWKQLDRGKVQSGDRCIVGLDVGSTTTKAVVFRESDQSILASVYLRTNGDPVGASKECYQALAKQLDQPIQVVGLGVTGSGRQIAGLHGQTEGVINEIIAHAAAAAHFDPEVDTIFEIGGQDAKYTHLSNRVASDYAMNEACSAGTGSFLEEAAKESLGVDTLEIGDLAMRGVQPPNFNDQCAAFIASDIKTAIQEGLTREDISAGLVYSICLNYLNRVKGNREVGRKVFMQGGVCYNKAVPVAMAALTGREIIVPPEPGLMGAYGVALEVQRKLELGLLQEDSFNLTELAERGVEYLEPFTCAGGKEACDLKCRIQRVKVNGENYLFGGSCNRYVNMRRNRTIDAEALDLITQRERLLFLERKPNPRPERPLRVGVNKSFMTHTLYPFYSAFFTGMGMEIVMPDSVDADGVSRQGAAFCYPAEVSHGAMASLLRQKPDAIFLPQVRGMFVENGAPESVVCPLAQGEPYYLKAAFPELSQLKLMTPILDFSQGFQGVRPIFLEIGASLGVDSRTVAWSFRRAIAAQRSFGKKLAKLGQEALAKLEQDPEQLGVVVFGRSYNAYTQGTNMGIPRKFASRGHVTFSLDMLAYAEEEPVGSMYWSTGQLILKAAKLVKRHPQLFAAYVTNFSCGPDSFLLGYFRQIMGDKPSLTLELDSHTADAGIDTRVEAFLDIVASHREIQRRKVEAQVEADGFRLAEVVGSTVVDSNGERLPLTHPRVKLVIPSMGERASRYIASTFRHFNMRAETLPVPGEPDLKVGRANSTCKECLPFTLVMGACLRYMETRQDPDEITVFFLPESAGPCRFGQYTVQLGQLLRTRKIRQTAILSLTCENGYAGFGQPFQLRAWRAVLMADVMDDIYSAVLVLSKDREAGLEEFHRVSALLEWALEKESVDGIMKALRTGTQRLAAVPRKGDIRHAKKVGVAGEIFVRRDPLSTQFLADRLAERDIICKVAPIHEWMYYTEYIYRNAIYLAQPNFMDRLGSLAKDFVKNRIERQIKGAFASSGFYEFRLVNVGKMIKSVEHLIPGRFTGGDAVLTVAAAMNEIVDETHGFIIIGPFGCLPNRIAEAVLTHSMRDEKVNVTDHLHLVKAILEQQASLPFLAIESDGGVFPQVVQARMETFFLQVDRLHATVEGMVKSH
nr:acyl-CoA dehydratase activase [uncultured Holophaga sp.]